MPQTKVLPLVDLVITHAGNNSFVESLYFGKPMIAMPLFADQLDNAQRLAETGLGLRMNPYKCTKEEVTEGIEKLINDGNLKQKYKVISERKRQTLLKPTSVDRLVL